MNLLFGKYGSIALVLAAACVCSGTGAKVVPPLSSRVTNEDGAFIVDATGAHVRLACANWYGAEEEDYVVGGLDHQNVSTIAGLIAEWGFNCVRLPWSVEMVLQNPKLNANVTTAAPQLQGATALDAYDAVIESLTSYGVMVILDNHMSDANWCCSHTDGNGLWYNDNWPEASWLKAWSLMAHRYASNPLVVGADLRNELRQTVVGGQSITPTWGGDASTDWPSAAERAAAVVLAANPELLIIVEGLHYAGDLTGVKSRPVLLPSGKQSKLVYEAHNYANFVPTWTKDIFDSALDTNWGYITEPGHSFSAPVWLGEFGTCHSPSGGCYNGTTSQAKWWGYLVDYIQTKNLNWGYWAIDGTQSRGTGRTFGAIETYGIANPSWSAPAQGGGLLRQLQAIMASSGAR